MAIRCALLPVSSTRSSSSISEAVSVMVGVVQGSDGATMPLQE
jgi:hypothetical protein